MNIDFFKINLDESHVDYINKREIYLCSPNRSRLRNINDIEGGELTIDLSEIHSLEFSIPKFVEMNHNLVNNEIYNLIQPRHLIELKIENYHEFFVVKKVEFNEDLVSISCVHEAIELQYQMIKEYKEDGMTIESFLNKILSTTNWSTGNIDSDLVKLQRSIDLSGTNLLEAVISTFNKFGCYAIYDSINRKVHVKKLLENEILNNGYEFDYRKFVQSYSYVNDGEKIVTRLKAFGRDGLTINRLVPNGTNYIEDMSYYEYPSDMKVNSILENKNSDLKSDELIFTLEEKQLTKELEVSSTTSDIIFSVSGIFAKKNGLEKIDFFRENEQTPFKSLLYKGIDFSRVKVKFYKVFNDVFLFVNGLYITQLLHTNLSFDLKFNGNKITNTKDEIIDFTFTKKATLMSDGLVFLNHVYKLKYDKYGSIHKELLANKIAKQEILSIKQNDLKKLDTELLIIKDELDTANAMKEKFNGYYHNDIVIRMIDKQKQVNDKKIEVELAKSDVSSIQVKIDELSKELSIENNFPRRYLEERITFTEEDEYNNDFITDEEALLVEAKKEFKKINTPKVDLKLDLIDLYNTVEGFKVRKYIKLGQVISFLIHEKNLRFKAKISSIKLSLIGENSTVEITNVTNNNQDDLLEKIYKSYSTSSRVDTSRYQWDKVNEYGGKINQLINEAWDATKKAVLSGTNQKIVMDERGIRVFDPKDPNRFLVIQNGVMAMTNDGGITWKHAFTPDGIYGERIISKIIMGVNLAIEDENGIIKFRGSKGSIFDRNGTQVMWLGLVSENPDCYGMITKNAHTKVSMTNCDGISISRYKGKDTDGKELWEKILWANTDGTLYTKDLVAQQLKIVNNIGKEILNAETNKFDFGSFVEIVVDDKLTAVEKLQLSVEWERIKSQFNLVKTSAEKFSKSTRDDLLLIDIKPLEDAYNALKAYVEPLLINMSETTPVDRAEFITKFKSYSNEVEKIYDLINESIRYSSLQIGTNYNNVIMDATNGFLAIRDDFKYRAFLNATHGLALQKFEDGVWKNKLHAYIGDKNYADGTLLAEDMVAKRLKIVNQFDEEVIDTSRNYFKLSDFNEIILDNKLTSVEKVMVRTQIDVITKNYNILKDQAKYFESSDRDEVILTDLTKLHEAYESLINYIAPYLKDMNSTSEVDRTLFQKRFTDYEDASVDVRNQIEKALKYSSLQLGKNYNDVTIDAKNGIVVERGDKIVKSIFNASEGIAIYTRPDTLSTYRRNFYVDTNGRLFANDLIAKKLTIINNSDEVIFDSNLKFFKISDFEEILLDGKLTSIEKINLQREIERIKTHYALLVEQADKYKYSERDSSILTDTSNLTKAYNELLFYVSGFLVDMNKSSNVDRREFISKFKKYEEEANRIRDAIEDALKYSSLQLGKNYNKTTIDAKNGIIVERGDGNVKTIMNATTGFKISVNEPNGWVDKFFVGSDGIITGVGLRLVGKEGELYIDADKGIIDFSKFKIIIGLLTADSINAQVVTATDGFINDLVVNRVKTIDLAKSKDSEIDYVHIQDNYMRFVTGTSKGTTNQAKDFKGNLLYWTDSSKTMRTIKETSHPVMVQDYDEKEKMKIHFKQKGEEKIPVIEMSVGAVGETGKAYLYKDSKKFKMEYLAEGELERSMVVQKEGIVLNASEGVVALNNSAFILSNISPTEKFYNPKNIFNLNGGLYIPEDRTGLYLSTLAKNGTKIARWMLNDNNYVAHSANVYTVYVGNTSTTADEEKIKFSVSAENGRWRTVHPYDIEVGGMIKPYSSKTQKIRLEVNSSNYIEISSSGIKIVGSRVDIN